MATRMPATPGMLASQNAAAGATAETQAADGSAAPQEAAAPQSGFKKLLGMAKGDAPVEGAGQATLGAEALNPPNTKKIIMGSMLRGAIAGGSLLFSANKFMPGMLGKIIGFIPLIPKVTFPMGTLAALGIGAAIGAAFGLFTGMRKAKAEVAKYAESQAAAGGIDPATGQPTGPVVMGPDGKPLLGPDGKPLAVDPATGTVTDPATGKPIMGPDGKPIQIDPATGTPIDPTTGKPMTGAPPGQPGAAAPAPAPKSKKKSKKNPVMGDDFKSGSAKSSKKAGKTDCGCDNCGPTAVAGASKAPASAKAARSGKTIDIQRGDTLGALARRHNTTVAAFMKANPKITNANLIYAGDTLHVPKAA